MSHVIKGINGSEKKEEIGQIVSRNYIRITKMHLGNSNLQDTPEVKSNNIKCQNGTS